MKKEQYLSPELLVLELKLEGVIAASSTGEGLEPGVGNLG